MAGKGCLPILIGLGLSIFSPDFSWSQSKEEVVQRVQSVYDGMESFKASFLQETNIRAAKKVIREEGKVYYRRPGSMRWDYNLPREKQVYISMKKSWLYLPAEKVAYVKEGEGVLSSHTLARFITGAGRIEEDFTVIFEGSEGEIKLTLRPREKTPPLRVLKITVSPKTFFITSCRYLDDYGNEVSIRFREMELNVPLDQKFFLFSPPHGVAVLPMQ